MNLLHRTALGLAAACTAAAAHAAPLTTGAYMLGSELASPGSFDASVVSASAGSANLGFELAGFASLDGQGNCCTDVFHLSLNGTEVFSGTFNMGGGGSNAILFNPGGGTAITTTFGASDDPHQSNQATWGGGITEISLPVNLIRGNNTLSFAYSGTAQGLGDEGWGVNHMALTAAVPEPETLALMLSGLAALGFIARRRRPVA
jgi:hypothetical protein